MSLFEHDAGVDHIDEPLSSTTFSQNVTRIQTLWDSLQVTHIWKKVVAHGEYTWLKSSVGILFHCIDQLVDGNNWTCESLEKSKAYMHDDDGEKTRHTTEAEWALEMLHKKSWLTVLCLFLFSSSVF